MQQLLYPVKIAHSQSIEIGLTDAGEGRGLAHLVTSMPIVIDSQRGLPDAYSRATTSYISTTGAAARTEANLVDCA